jgi:hypothetical protein
VSPIEGRVADMIDAVVRDPARARQDPCRDAWLLTAQSPGTKTNFRHLQGGAMVDSRVGSPGCSEFFSSPLHGRPGSQPARCLPPAAPAKPAGFCTMTNRPGADPGLMTRTTEWVAIRSALGVGSDWPGALGFDWQSVAQRHWRPSEFSARSSVARRMASRSSRFHRARKTRKKKAGISNLRSFSVMSISPGVSRNGKKQTLPAARPPARATRLSPRFYKWFLSLFARPYVYLCKLIRLTRTGRSWMCGRLA